MTSNHNNNYSLKTLVADSTPDFPPVIPYQGPPIGYSALVISHRTPYGLVESHFFGDFFAPRPRFFELWHPLECPACAYRSRCALAYVQALYRKQRDSGVLFGSPVSMEGDYGDDDDKEEGGVALSYYY